MADPQITESGLRRHAQGSRGREGAQDPGSGVSGEGSAWGSATQGPGWQGWGGRTPGLIRTNEKPKKTAPLSPAGTQDLSITLLSLHSRVSSRGARAPSGDG